MREIRTLRLRWRVMEIELIVAYPRDLTTAPLLDPTGPWFLDVWYLEKGNLELGHLDPWKWPK